MIIKIKNTYPPNTQKFPQVTSNKCERLCHGSNIMIYTEIQNKVQIQRNQLIEFQGLLKAVEIWPSYWIANWPAQFGKNKIIQFVLIVFAPLNS